MAVEAQSDQMQTDFSGMIDTIDNSLKFAEVQVNLQNIVIGEMTTRPGVREVVFEG
jgi:hypothetical protein